LWQSSANIHFSRKRTAAGSQEKDSLAAVVQCFQTCSGQRFILDNPWVMPTAFCWLRYVMLTKIKLGTFNLMLDCGDRETQSFPQAHEAIECSYQ
jgi:hypothetical protein